MVASEESKTCASEWTRANNWRERSEFLVFCAFPRVGRGFVFKLPGAKLGRPSGWGRAL